LVARSRAVTVAGLIQDEFGTKKCTYTRGANAVLNVTATLLAAVWAGGRQGNGGFSVHIEQTVARRHARAGGEKRRSGATQQGDKSIKQEAGLDYGREIVVEPRGVSADWRELSSEGQRGGTKNGGGRSPKEKRNKTCPTRRFTQPSREGSIKKGGRTLREKLQRGE